MKLLNEIRFRLGSARHARKIHADLRTARDLYLDHMEQCLTGGVHGQPESGEPGRGRRIRELTDSGQPILSQTMIGRERLRNVRFCTEQVIRHDVPGDLIEAGVWRGGATILMRAVLGAFGDQERKVWVADSFEGLPPPNPAKYEADAGDEHFKNRELAVSLEEVQGYFKSHGLLDDRVRFLKGWFKDTLPGVPVKRFSVVRLDGDMYESTMDGLTSLYPKLSVGGYLIVDDYGAVPACRKAVEDYRREQGIEEEIVSIDWTGIYWKRKV